MPGPAPKRSTERRRRNAGSQTETVVVPGTVAAPPTPSGLQPIAREWFEALKTSGQATFYEPSDWATARYVAEAMSRSLEGAQMSAMMFASVMSAMSSLLVTEGERRRVRMEIERNKPAEDTAPAGVTALAAYRRKAR